MSNRSRAIVRWLLVSAFAAGAAEGVAKQTPQQPSTPATGLIVGRVVDADSGAGVAGVLVTLSPVATAPSAVGELLESRAPVEAFSPTPNPAVRRTLTAPDGRFVFRDLAKGRFNIFATSPRYAPGSYGQLRPQGPAIPLEIGDAERVGNLSIRLWRFGSISGVVRDESGEPAAGVSLECSRRVITGGQRRYTVVGTAVTDDRGMYRASNLPPSDYICGYSPNSTTMPAALAAGAAGATAPGEASFSAEESRRMSNSATSPISSGFRIGDFIYSNGAGTFRGPIPPVSSDGRMFAYGNQFFSGAGSTSQATLIGLKAGEDRTGIDIQLRLVPAVRITGRLLAPDGPGSFLGVRLVPASGNDMVSEGQAEFSRTITDATGAFAFLGVPAGQYVIRSRMFPQPVAGGNPAAALDETSLWAATPITVGDTDILNLEVRVRAGLRVTGRLEFSGANQPTPAQVQRITVRMQGAEGRTSSPVAVNGRVGSDATFKTAGYPAGRYIGNVLPNTIPAGWNV